MSERRAFELQIEEAKNDRGRLRQIDDEINRRPELGSLRYRIAGHVNRLKKAEMARASLATAVSQFGIPHPDERWLYQYAISDEKFEKLQQVVTKAAEREELHCSWNPAYFVLWAAEWFRRYHPGGVRKWADLEAALGTCLPQSDWRNLTERGLACWGREVIKGSSFRYFLSTLAREGGFPAAALAHGNESWASSVLAAMVSAMLAEDFVSDQRALEIAQAQRGRIPAIFSDEDFIQLCADLALQIARLRKRADAKAAVAGIPVAAWLDAHESGWREALPISRNERSGLIDELLAVKAHRLPKGYLEATRYLVRSEESWVEAVQLELDGELSDAIDGLIPRGSGRLWAYASGELSRYIPGDVAHLDPSVGEKAWLQASGRTNALHQVPFTCPIELDLRSSDRSELRLAIPGGAAVRSRMLVFTIDRQRDGKPIELLFRGHGSGRFRQESVVVAVPTDWAVTATSDGETIAELGKGPGVSVLWEISGGALVTNPRGDVYRVLCGQAADYVDSIAIEGALMPNFVSPEDSQTDMFIGPLQIRLMENHKSLPTAHRLFTRPVDGGNWSRFDASVDRGHFELAWIEGNITRASRRILLFPRGSSLERTGVGAQARYTIISDAQWSLSVDDDAPVRSAENGTKLIARSHGELQRRFRAAVIWGGHGNKAASGILLEFPCGAGISDWEGRLSPPNARLTLRGLRQLQAHADGKMTVFGDLIDEDGSVVPGTELRWSFENEMPLAVLEPELRALLSPRGPRAFVKLGMLDGIEDYWSIHQFDPAVVQDSRGFYSPAPVTDEGASIRFRSLSRYPKEINAARYSLTDTGSHQPVPSPESVRGPFLCYVRARESILTTPTWFHAQAAPDAPCDVLAKVMLEEQSGAVDEFLRELDHDQAPSRSALDALVRLIVSLDGLPPRVFRVLERLPNYPMALLRTLGAASPERRQTVLELDKSLPFGWYLLPAHTWQVAMQEIVGGMNERLNVARVPDPDRYFGEMLADFRRTLLLAQPCAHDLVFPGNAPDLTQAAQVFLNAHVDTVKPTSGSIFRDAGIAGLPRSFQSLPDHCLETLDAPCAAAAAANGDWVPQERHIERIKTVNRRYPEYFRAAFAASMR